MSEGFENTGKFEVKELGCVRGGRTLFEGLSFSLNPGQGVVLTGPNGSGKTSLLRILAGFLAPASGSLIWAGDEAKNGFDLLPGYSHFLGHAQALKPFLTVRENLKFWQKILGGSGDLEGPSKKTGVSELLDFPVKFLSEGQRKRVNLARFLVEPLPIWLMDEPAAGLDNNGQQILGGLILEHLKKGGIFIAATHQELAIEGLKEVKLGQGASKGKSK